MGSRLIRGGQRRRRWLPAARPGAIVLMAGALLWNCLSSFGKDPSGDELIRIRKSQQYRDGSFRNKPEVPMIVEGKFWQMVRRQLFGSEVRVPPGKLPVTEPVLVAQANVAPETLRVAWLGHSTNLVEIDGLRVLTDPVFERRVSPVTFAGPERFFPPPVPREKLPPIDVVVVSHDHYDHLEEATARALAAKGTVYVVPLGIGSHLRKWGVPENRIVELDWWEEHVVRGVRFVCTPAVHYSGRGLFGGNKTLWASWSIVGPKHRFFHSGDTGFSPHLAEIGRRLGPFDLTSIKVGAYDYTWELIHMSPEHAVESHVALRGVRMLPVHWATFNMAIHRWDEPILRTKAEAAKRKVELVTPRPGEWVTAGAEFASSDWWTVGNKAP